MKGFFTPALQSLAKHWRRISAGLFDWFSMMNKEDPGSG
jgi:hypothetical protein